MTPLGDAIYAIAWQAVTLGVIASAWRLVAQLFPEARGAAKWLHVGVLSLAIVLIGLTLTGGLGLILRSMVLVCVATVAGSGWLVARRLVIESAGEVEHESPNSPSAAKVLWIWAIALLAGHVICHGLLQFPSDWDTLMYHLPFIDHWIQSGTLEATQSARWSMPATNELLGLWFAAPFSGDFLVALNNVPVVILWAFACLELGRALGLTGWWPHLMAVNCLVVQTTVRQTVDASNDLMVAAMFTAGMAYVLRYAREGSSRNALMFGVCLGILGSVKYFAMGYAAVLAAVFIGVCCSRPATGTEDQMERAGMIRGQRRLSALILVFGSALFCGGYWFMRNTWMTGYPLFPIGTSQFADRLPYPGMHNTMLLFHLDETASDLVLDSIWHKCGPAQVVALVAAPTIALWLIWEAFNRPGAARTRNEVLVLCLLGSLSVYLVTPMLVEDQPGTLNQLRWGYTTVRYGLSFLSCATIACFVGVAGFAHSCRPVGQRIVLGLGMLLTGYQVVHVWFGTETLDLQWPAVIATILAVLFVVIEAVSLKLPRARWLMLVGGVVIAAWGVAYLSQRWHAGFAAHFDRYGRTTVFSQLAQTPHRILVLEERSYPYFGSRRQNFVEQPMLFYGVEDVLARLENARLDIVAARSANPNAIARYRRASADLSQSASFEDCTPAIESQIRLFRRRGSSQH